MINPILKMYDKPDSEKNKKQKGKANLGSFYQNCFFQQNINVQQQSFFFQIV